jgi:hypothetical protein
LGVTGVTFSSAENKQHGSEQHDGGQRKDDEIDSERYQNEQNKNAQHKSGQHKISGRLEDLSKKKELGKEAEAEACDISRKSSEDIPPEPGNPNFWPSTDLNIVEDLEPPSRNKPDSSPWCEVQEVKEDQKEKQPPIVEQPSKGEEGEEE